MLPERQRSQAPAHAAQVLVLLPVLPVYFELPLTSQTE